jgi:hypothetical protein
LVGWLVGWAVWDEMGWMVLVMGMMLMVWNWIERKRNKNLTRLL